MADVKISALPAATTLAGTEDVPIVQTGGTVRTTAQAIANLVSIPVSSVNTKTGAVVLNTNDVAEGTTNKYFSDTRARNALSATGSLSYNSTTGVLSYTQPTNVSTFTNDSGYLTSSAIGTTVQGYNANTVVDASYVHTDNNYTTTEKSKLAGIAAGAEVNVKADWNAVSGAAQILNKPSLATVATSGAYSDLSGTPTIPSAIAIKDEGTTLTSAPTSIDFVGANVTATNVGGAVTVTISGGGGGSGTVTSVSGTGTVSGLTLSGTVTSSGSLTLGGTLAVAPSDFASQTANTILAAPNGVAGTPTFRALVAADVPTLNQNTTGTASNVTGTVAVANGGTGLTSLTANYIPYGNGTSAYSSSSQFQYNGTYLLTGAASALGGLTNPVAAFTGNPGTTNYVQTYIYNAQNGASSSADLVAYANNSTDAHGWADIGFTSQTYADATYTVTGANEAYLFGSAPSGAGATGNLVYATDSTGSTNAHQWYVGGFTQAKNAWKMQLTSTGLQLANALGVAYGGTGATTLTGLVVGNGTSAMTTVAAPSGTVVGTSDTQTLTNKRINPRVSTTTSSATPTINTDNVDVYGLTAQAVDITSFTTNLSGTPVDGQKLWIYIVGTAARAITWGASFESSTATLPTTTVTTNRLDVGFVWNAATSKWRCMASA